MAVGKSRKVAVRMVENYPPKDKGDNADGVILENFGAVTRKSIDISEYMGRGKMHSKFLVADRKSFYLGSANLDWRSLNQKMELGVLVEDCECLGEDMHNIFHVLWDLKVRRPSCVWGCAQKITKIGWKLTILQGYRETRQGTRIAPRQ